MRTPTSLPEPEAARAEGRTAVEVREITDLPSFEALRDPWNALLAGCRAATPAQSLEWLSAWWRAYGTGLGMSVLVAERAGDLVAALPLMSKRIGPCRLLRYLGTPRVDAADVLCRTGEEDACTALLENLGASRDWDLIWLQEIDSAAALIPPLEGAAHRHGWGLAARDWARRPYITLGKTWEEYLAGRSRNLRRNIRRESEKMAAAGRSLVEWRLDFPDAAKDVALLAGIESRSWRAGAGADRFQTPADRLFTRLMLEAFSPRGWAAMAVQRLDGDPIAHLVEFRFAGRRFGFNLAYDASMSHLSPGSLLLARAVEEACRDGAVEYDFQRGEDDYKSSWTDGVRQNRDILIWRRTPRGILGAFAVVRAKWLFQGSRIARRAVAWARRRSGAGGRDGADGRESAR